MAQSPPDQTTENHDEPTGGGGDKLSALPDDLLLPILTAADMDLLTAVRTSLFSTRWRSLWKSFLPALRFQIPSSYCHWKSLRSRRLVEFALSVPDFGAQLSLLSLTIDTPLGREWADLLDRTYSYLLAHRIPTLHIAAQPTTTPTRPVKLPLPISSAKLASVQTLSLSLLCFDLHSAFFLSLTSLRLDRCVIRRYSSFALIPNLEKLELSYCHVDDPIKLSAPRCRYLSCSGVYPITFSTVQLPSLECLDIDYEMIKSHFNTIVGAFEQFGHAECVKLRPNVIKVLVTSIRRLLRQRSSPFKRLKRVELYLDGTTTTSTGRRELNSLISYMFGDHVPGSTPSHPHYASQGIDQKYYARPPVIVCKSDFVSYKSGLEETEG